MGLFLKTGAGRRLRKYRIDISGYELFMGLPGNLSRDLPKVSIKGMVDLYNNNTFDKNGMVEISNLMWDYHLPLWKEFGDSIGSLWFHMHIEKMPNGKTCGTLDEIEYDFRNYFSKKFPKGNKWQAPPPKHYQRVFINGTEWLAFERPIGKEIGRGDMYYYCLPLTKQHFLTAYFDIGFGKAAQERAPKYYQQALNDVERIKNSFRLIKLARVGGDALEA